MNGDIKRIQEIIGKPEMHIKSHIEFDEGKQYSLLNKGVCVCVCVRVHERERHEI